MIDLLTTPLSIDTVAKKKKQYTRSKYLWSVCLMIFSIAIVSSGISGNLQNNDLGTGVGLFNLVLSSLFYLVCFGFQLYFIYGLVFKRENDYDYVQDHKFDLTSPFITKLTLTLFKKLKETSINSHHEYLHKPSQRYPEVALFKKKVDLMGRPLTLLEYRSMDAWMKAKDFLLS